MEKQTNDSDTVRQLRRLQRREEMKRKKRRQAFFRKFFLAGLFILLLVTLSTIFVVKRKKDKTPEQNDTVSVDQKLSSNSISVDQPGIQLEREQDVPKENDEETTKAEEKLPLYQYTTTEDTLSLGDDIKSTYAILIDADQGTILAGKREKERMIPASMTKVLTLLVAVEHISNFDDTFTITREIADYCYRNDCSVAGFEKEETVRIKDLLYGTILPSGADAALGLALYTAGSQETFVEMMNEKLDELGLSDTSHFTNCIGIFDENHYSSAYDMAVILNAAIDHELCREVLSAHTYQTSPTSQHPEGILLSNWFLRRIEDKDTGGEVVCGKTGYVEQSGSCAASYGTTESGSRLICVTANGNSQWICINDHANLYKRFSNPEEHKEE